MVQRPTGAGAHGVKGWLSVCSRAHEAESQAPPFEGSSASGLPGGGACRDRDVDVWLLGDSSRSLDGSWGCDVGRGTRREGGKACGGLCWAGAKWKCKSRSNIAGLMRVPFPGPLRSGESRDGLDGRH